MYSCVVVVALLLFSFQSPQEQYRERFEAAEAQRRAGNIDKAQNEYVSILADAYQKLGRAYSAQGNHRAAAAAFESAVKFRPNSPETLVELSIELFNTGQFEQALANYNRSIQLDPNLADVYQNRGILYLFLGRDLEAANDFEKCLELDPSSKPALNRAVTMAKERLANRMR